MYQAYIRVYQVSGPDTRVSGVSGTPQKPIHEIRSCCCYSTTSLYCNSFVKDSLSVTRQRLYIVILLWRIVSLLLDYDFILKGTCLGSGTQPKAAKVCWVRTYHPENKLGSCRFLNISHNVRDGFWVRTQRFWVGTYNLGSNPVFEIFWSWVLGSVGSGLQPRTHSLEPGF